MKYKFGLFSDGFLRLKMEKYKKSTSDGRRAKEKKRIDFSILLKIVYEFLYKRMS